VRVAGARAGNAVALVRDGTRLLAYIADADSRSLHTIDVDAGHELARTRLDGEPRQVLVLADGRVATTLSDGTRVAILEPTADPAAPLAPVCTRDLPAEPWGIAASPDDAKVVVTSAWGSALSVLDEATMDVRRVVPLPRDPRGVLVDGHDVAFVSHVVGAAMSTVDLAADDSPDVVDLSLRKSSPLASAEDLRTARTGSQGYALASLVLPAAGGSNGAMEGAERVFAPMVSVDPGDPERRSSVYYGPPFDGVPKETPTVAVVDTDTERAMTRYLLGTSEKELTRECLLPRAAAVEAKAGRLLVACYGIDAVLDLDARAADPLRAERRRFDVPAGPTGIAVDEDAGRAVVFSQMQATVTVIDLAGDRGAFRHVAVDYHPDPGLASVARGRMLFYRTDDTRISSDGIACSSCHVDGREDGLTWTTPFGPRQTPMLAGRLPGTAPYGWVGDQKTLADYIQNTVTRLGGNGIAGTDVDDIAKYLLTIRAPPDTARQDVLVARGHALFDDEKQGCATCHAGGTTDGQGHRLVPKPKDSQTSFDTPSLRFVRGTAPYFHDGRYKTIEALLADPESAMGHSALLPEGDREALAAYLRSL
jgi:DNA-binding beta-propeller fold protein YncE